MKSAFCLLTVLFCFNLSYAQNKTLKGQFTGKNLDKSFINVINLNQYKATISQEDGRFKIPAKVGDSILISSIQYSEVKFIVKPEFFEDDIEIPLKLKVNELQDVNLYSLGLTGDLEKDTNNIKLDKSQVIDFGNFDISKIYDEKVTTQSEFSIRNVAMEQNYIPTNFNIRKIIGLIGSLLSKKQEKTSQTLLKNPYDNSLKILEDTEFFVNDLKIEKHRINDFMTYVKSQGLEKQIDNRYNSEMDLIQFLLDKSREFNKSSAKKN